MKNGNSNVMSDASERESAPFKTFEVHLLLLLPGLLHTALHLKSITLLGLLCSASHLKNMWRRWICNHSAALNQPSEVTCCAPA